jgi:uncharacterized protein YegJ (DUF2314 family)
VRFQDALASDASLANLFGRAVKFAFTAKDGRIEHMWVRVTAHRGNKIRGVLMSTPFYDQGDLKMNDRVKCDIRTASDMMFDS